MLSRIAYPLGLCTFALNILSIWQSVVMRNYPMGNDEYFFYRTTMNLPHYETTGRWLTEEGAPNKASVDTDSYLFDSAYTRPVWVHPLVANAVAYPIAVIFTDVARQVQWLRLVDVLFIIATVFLLSDIIRRWVNPYVATASLLPLFVGRGLLANGIMFYNDLFMWFFFALTMWIITVRPHSKWVVALSALAVMMKSSALLLIVPILLYLYYQTKNRRLVVRAGIASLGVFLAYLIFQAVVAGDALYLLRHWGTLNPNARLNITKNVLPYFWSYALSWGLWLSLPLIVGGIAAVIKRKIAMWYGFGAFGVVVLAFAFGWGLYAYQTFPVMYASMFMIPVLFFKDVIRRKSVELA